jgi:hypothetical protein
MNVLNVFNVYPITQKDYRISALRSVHPDLIQSFIAYFNALYLKSSDVEKNEKFGKSGRFRLPFKTFTTKLQMP